jgi:tRNA G10  N-methylase Trm11
MTTSLLKLSFIPGLTEVVLREVAEYPELLVVESGTDFVYLKGVQDFEQVKKFRSITNAYLVLQSAELNPHYISKHKSILGGLIESVIVDKSQKFKSFKLSCAGSDSAEVREIEKYIKETFKLIPAEDADMKIHIGKIGDLWEVGVQVTSRPLSLRDYKTANIPGAMNPTIAYAMNSLCDIESAQSYLNVCCGSGTLLIEAGLLNPNIKLVGFDNDGIHIAKAVQNIKQAGLIKRVTLKNADVLDAPDLGTFDIIVSDLPFGMQIGKGNDLSALYQSFVDYCETALSSDGTLAVYTTEHAILEPILKRSKFSITKTLGLKIVTSVNSYIYPKIFICKFTK